MPSTIVLFDQLTGAETGGTWSRISASGPAAPALYDDSIDFAGEDVGYYTYRYTVTDSIVTDTADVVVYWQGDAPARVNGECADSTLITGTMYPPFVVSTTDNNSGSCGPKGQQVPSISEDPVPTNWNQGTYTGDLWYSFILPAQASTYTLIFELSGTPFGSSGIYGPAMAVYVSALDGECGDKVIAGSIAGNGGSQRVSITVVVPANTERYVRIRVASLDDSTGSFNLSVTAIGSANGTVSGGGAASGTRIVQYVYDAGGTGILLWTENDGVLPDNLTSGFEVYSNGVRLESPGQYSVTPDSGPGQSTVTIMYPAPDQYYTLISYYE